MAGQLPGLNYTEYTGNPSTGAPGSGHSVNNPLDPTGDPTTELETPPAYNLAESTWYYADQSGMPHNGIDAAQTHNSQPGHSANPQTTGAHSGGDSDVTGNRIH